MQDEHDGYDLVDRLDRVWYNDNCNAEVSLHVWTHDGSNKFMQKVAMIRVYHSK